MCLFRPWTFPIMSPRSHPTLDTYVFSKGVSNSEAYSLLTSAIRGLMPRSDVAATPLCDLLPDLERIFYGKQAVLAASASEAGATPPYVVPELVRQTQALRSAGLPAGAVVAVGAGVSGAPAVADAGEVLEAALSGAAFVRFRQVMLSTDLLTAAGRRKVFEEGDCILPIRLLLSGEAGLAKKDSALGALMGLRPFLSE